MNKEALENLVNIRKLHHEAADASEVALSNPVASGCKTHSWSPSALKAALI